MKDTEAEIVRRHLEKLLASRQLAKADAGRRLLAYLTERSLQGEVPKEVEIAIDVFGKDASFSGAEDSQVRVYVRTLRQRLAEYYADAGREDEVRFAIPKGGYRLVVESRAHAPPSSPAPTHSAPSRRLAWCAAIAIVLLAGSASINVFLWNGSREADSAYAPVRNSAIWADLAASNRPLTLVLGDLFLFTQLDPQTGRTQTVRDPLINTSEELRQFLASNPSLAAERGQRYVTLVPKAAAIGMASILRLLDRPDRRVEVRILDELQAEDIRDNDIVYIGPFVRLGPLAGHYLRHSRYRYEVEHLRLVDTVSEQSYSPAGRLADQRVDYGLAAKFPGPTGNRIVILASVTRNVGLLQIVRSLTSREGIEALEAELHARSSPASTDGGASFEALLSVTGFRRTDLGAEIVNVSTMPASPPKPATTAGLSDGSP